MRSWQQSSSGRSDEYNQTHLPTKTKQKQTLGFYGTLHSGAGTARAIWRRAAVSWSTFATGPGGYILTEPKKSGQLRPVEACVGANGHTNQVKKLHLGMEDV